MGRIIEALKLFEPTRTLALNGMLKKGDPGYEHNLGGQQPFPVKSDMAFKVRYTGEIIEIKKGDNSFSRNFAVYLCHKYNGKTPIGDGNKKPIVIDADPVIVPESKKG